MIRTMLAAAAFAAGVAAVPAQAAGTGSFPDYHLLKSVHVKGSDSGWDYVTFDAKTKQLFVGHRLDGVEVFDTAHGFAMRKVPNTLNANDVAVISRYGLGVAAANTGTLTVFRLSNFSTVKKITVGKELDSSVYDPVTRRLVPVNTNETADKTGQVLTVYAVPSFKPVGKVTVPTTDIEHSVTDGKGGVYFADQKNDKIIRLDLKTLKITATYPTTGCTQPTGLDFDRQHQRLFIACRGHRKSPSFIVMDAGNGHVVFTAPISAGNDGVAYDPKNGYIFATNGLGANMFIFHEDGADKYHLAEILDTSTNQRTLALDVAGDRVFTVAAEGKQNPAHKILAFVSPFYPNKFTPNTFTVREYGK